MSGVMTDMDAGRRYVLVIAGYQDYDWGAFSTTIGGLGTVTISAVPEPSFGMLLLLGLGGMAVAARRRAARA
ncbi:MAG: PEP-CTERM sorting domain-containing protein, partial [Paucibacter sp.]|nr:PEP-CTERM sorting domain-containing protein [Roseateles sp.]